MQPELPSYDDVARASERLAGNAHRTPVLTSATADAIAGASRGRVVRREVGQGNP